ncbi:hypothetical protein [Rhizobium leguminosarum]|uniref:hypothetical protein n=1 Tax=Rhizobium leguminosarum TaxID=384 RepID=UPI00103A6970|nr:hypothetical protein [Rhizobium leguminosarum]MBY5798971.1 hypothetical protein [Rhizobium leguminosarum]TBZ15820.1 hypothetical protein E0H33_12985 [Rhizobium leguminosarum bv. viciae]
MQDTLLDAIANSFIASADRDGFNGTTASTLRVPNGQEADLRGALSDLVRDGKITAVFSSRVVNMHIKRFPDMPLEMQLNLLATEPLSETCLYPAKAVVESRVNLSNWHDRPFSKALLLAEAQLEFKAFELGVLERYVNDPRYVVHFADYMGRMSIGDDTYADEHHPDRDKIYLQTFGLGFDVERRPYVVAFLRYLSTLTPEHQQYWNSFLTTGDIRMARPYYQSSIEGNFWANRSIRHAITEEMRLIRELSTAIWGHSLFKPIVGGDVPIGLTSFLRPTSQNFDRFVMALDKMLSDSIDVKFFDGKVHLEKEAPRSDGKIVVSRKGTLVLLEEWLLNEVNWENPQVFKDIIIKPLRAVRQLRQKPAHTFSKDVFSADYHQRRRRLLCDVLNSLSNIRNTFSCHPLAAHIAVPDWLDSGSIDVF